MKNLFICGLFLEHVTYSEYLTKENYSSIQTTDFAKVHGENVNNIARNAVVSSKIKVEENANMYFFYAL